MSLTEDDTGMAERMCIVSRQVRDEADLIRFVRGPDGAAVPDLARKLPGRGVWVSLNRQAVAEATRKNLFAKALEAEVRPAPDLADRVEALLRQAALALIPLARKAGEAVAGYVKVEEMLGRGRASILIHAAEAQPDGCRKLDGLAGEDVRRCGTFNRDELDLAFGRSNVVHAAVARGGLAGKLREALRRMDVYEAQAGPK
ncbi:MAG: RNA-binding protein [Alphaproteobacteria bacterium]|nr:RNA-binding protein [Alphaproteobacteria bacterium]